MFTTSQGIDKFLGAVSHCTERDKVLEAIKGLRHTKGYKCPTVSVFALHLILDLYGEDSSQQANVNRITTNLEAAADDLIHLSKRLKAIG
jgi:hypothetical protein